MNLYIKYILIGLAVLGLGVAIGRYTLPAKIVEKKVVEVQEKIVEKIVYKESKDIKKDKVTIRLVTIKPDGTKTIETKIYDKSEIEITQSTDKVVDTSKDTSIKTEKTTEYAKDQWMIAAAAKANLNNIQPSYGLHIQKRFLGPIYLGGFAFLDGSVGASVGLGL